jgi:hypothetical protein
MGIAWILAGHAVVCCVGVLCLALVGGGEGFFSGVFVATLSWGLVPFILLPVGHVCGDMAHRIFTISSISVPLATRLFAVLFELNLLTWIIVALVSQHQ